VQQHDGRPVALLEDGERDAIVFDPPLAQSASYPRGMVIDVTEQTFEAEVIERSKSVPVVVDFWAEWCAPCRQLGPLLERGANAREGQVVLAKLDTDANPRLAAAFRIQGIPAVKAFKDGRVVSEFVGAQPPQQVEAFLDALVPSEVEGLVEAGDEASLRRAIELEPARADARLKLARLLRERGADDEALEVLGSAAGNFAAEGLAARIRLEKTGEPDLSEAFAALDRGEREAALDALLAAFPSADGAKDDLRRIVVGILDELGVDDPLAREYRRKLAAALY
jgi:putative thioredoxin